MPLQSIPISSTFNWHFRVTVDFCLQMHCKGWGTVLKLFCNLILGYILYFSLFWDLCHSIHRPVSLHPVCLSLSVYLLTSVKCNWRSSLHMAHRHGGDIVCAVAANCSPCSFESIPLLDFLLLLVFKLCRSSNTLLVGPPPNKLHSTLASFWLSTQLFLAPTNLSFFNDILNNTSPHYSFRTNVTRSLCIHFVKLLTYRSPVRKCNKLNFLNLRKLADEEWNAHEDTTVKHIVFATGENW